MVKVKNDLTGKIFGKLTVLRQAEDYISPLGEHRAQWMCQCSCGSKPVVVQGTSLTRGFTKSCGCLQKAEQKYFDNFAPQKHLYEKYGVLEEQTRNTDHLFVCSHCLTAIVSREGNQATLRHDIDLEYDEEDFDKMSKCDWCEQEGFDLLYELV